MIVFDASTLILITKIELLDSVLTGVAQEVAIPAEVARECCGVKKSLDAIVIQRAIEESRIKVLAVKNRKLVVTLCADFSLGEGEGEAIALAIRKKAQFLGIDDKNGINACKLLGIQFTTAIGFLIRSREKGLVDSRTALAMLATLAIYGRYKDSIIMDARQKLEAQR